MVVKTAAFQAIGQSRGGDIFAFSGCSADKERHITLQMNRCSPDDQRQRSLPQEWGASINVQLL